MERVGVVGCGLMGSGIAEVCARAGLDVLVSEANDEFAAAGRRRIESSLERAVRSTKIESEDMELALERLRFTTDLADMADREIVVEAVPEIESAKLQVFGVLDRVVESRDAVLASNTSSIPIMKLAMATERPDHVVGIHFFNPVPVLRLVELVTSLLTSEETVAKAEDFAATGLGKR